MQRTRPRASCIDHLVMRPGRAAELHVRHTVKSWVAKRKLVREETAEERANARRYKARSCAARAARIVKKGEDDEPARARRRMT